MLLLGRSRIVSLARERPLYDDSCQYILPLASWLSSAQWLEFAYRHHAHQSRQQRKLRINTRRSLQHAWPNVCGMRCMTLRVPNRVCSVTGRLQVLRRTSLLPAILVLGTAGRRMCIIDMESPVLWRRTWQHCASYVRRVGVPHPEYDGRCLLSNRMRTLCGRGSDTTRPSSGHYDDRP